MIDRVHEQPASCCSLASVFSCSRSASDTLRCGCHPTELRERADQTPQTQRPRHSDCIRAGPTQTDLHHSVAHRQTASISSQVKGRPSETCLFLYGVWSRSPHSLASRSENDDADDEEMIGVIIYIRNIHIVFTLQSGQSLTCDRRA